MTDLRTDLSDAAQSGDTDRLKALLDRNRSFASMPDEQGYTPLHYAAYFGHQDAATYLLSIGAELTAVSLDPLRSQPLHAAASSGNRQIAGLLLDAGADPNAEQTGQWTPLHSAAAGGHTEIVRLLLAQGADPTRRSASGATPKDLAAERGHHACVEALS
ncbi:MAG TPA: ankyrin repeat domain-containing protein [Gemmatimonadales bacterium]|nr:ankyrin repeat domain-containing protein [Gemmatimonadales bacterium]